jgi:hypothetical protein
MTEIPGIDPSVPPSGTGWFWDYQSEEAFAGPRLAPPVHHPADRPAPGPAGRVPRDWRRHIH